MPIYEYECEPCDKRFEVIQRLSDSSTTTCPDCRRPVRKLISSPAGLIFKGSGWYINDYAKKGTGTGTGTGEGADPKKTDSSKGTEGTGKEGSVGTTKESPPSTTPSTAEAQKKETPKKEVTQKSGASSSSGE